VVDFHNYPARRKHLVAQRLRLGWDVCLDIPTNPAAGCRADAQPLHRLFEALREAARTQGFHFGRYGIYKQDGSFRHGTPQLGDARNTITLRYETPTLLIEARNPSRGDLAEDREMLRSAIAGTAREICRWAVSEASFLQDFSLPAKEGSRIPMGFLRRAGVGVTVPVRSIENGALGEMGPARDRCRVDGRRHRVLPASYRVPSDVLDVLERQEYDMRQIKDGMGEWVVPVAQTGGRMLALLLDEESRYQPED
jgi:hypothetical protein